MNWPADIHIFLEVVFAMFLGGLIGCEREISDKLAGLRTHMLVGGSATLLVGLGSTLVDSFTSDNAVAMIRSDPIRIVQAIVVGISFLGAGTIVRSNQGDVQGLTTAASVLFTAAIGIAVALQRYVLALAVTLLALVVLRVIFILFERASRRER